MADAAPEVAVPKVDMPAADAAVSTSASDDDESALKQGAASSSFSFRRDAPSFSFSPQAAEFVMPSFAPQAFASAFSFNAGACEFTPVPVVATGPASPMLGPTFLQSVPVMAPANAPVYPVVAVTMPPNGLGMRPVTYLPSSNVIPMAPMATAGVTGFGHGSFHDGHRQQMGGGDSRKGGGKGQHRQGYKGNSPTSPPARSAHQEQKLQTPLPPPSPEFSAADFPAALKKAGDTEAQLEEAKEDSEDEGKEKKPTWADLARQRAAMAKPTSPTTISKATEPRTLQLPSKAHRTPVPTKAHGAPPTAGKSAPATLAVAAASSPPAPVAVVATASASESEDAAAVLHEEAPVATNSEASATPAGAIAVETDADAEATTDAAESSEKPKEKGPPSWADRMKMTSAPSAPLARPKKGAPSKPVGIPANPVRAPWAKVTAAASDAAAAPAMPLPESSEKVSSSDRRMTADFEASGSKAFFESRDSDFGVSDEQLAELNKASRDSDFGISEEQLATLNQVAADAAVDAADVEKAKVEVKKEDEVPVKAEAFDIEEDDDEEESAADFFSSMKEKITKTEGMENLVDSASSKLASELGKPDANGIIKYSVAWLKSMAKAPGSQGNCPPNIPAVLRNVEDGGPIENAMSPTEDRKRYKLNFLKQFKEKEVCKELPANHRIPKDIRAGGAGADRDRHPAVDKEDNWRNDQVNYQARMKDKDKGDRNRDGKKGRNFERQEALVSSENSWAQQQQGAKQEAEANVIRNMKSILNKLTVEKFEKLYQQLLECGIRSQEHVEKLMSEVFEKATTQHHFISMYTDLCCNFNGWLSEQGIPGSDGKPLSFKRILLNQCQDSFEKYIQPPQGFDDISGEALFEAKLKYKTKMLGNMKFVGQLLINKVLSSKIIFQCTYALLDNPSEEKLETLCAFLNTIGPAYDTKEWKYYSDLTKVFAEVKMLSGPSVHTDIPPRIKFLMKDIAELRAAGWDKDIRPSNEPKGPMKMSDVKREWAKDHQVGDVKSLRKNAPEPLQDADDEWATVGKLRMGSTKGASASTPSGQGRPATATNSSGNKPQDIPVRPSTTTNSFGLLEGKKKEKKKDDMWRRAGAAPSLDRSTSGRSQWKEKEKPTEVDNTASSPSRGEAGGAEPSEEECLTEVQSAITEFMASHDANEAIARVQALKIPSRHQKAVVSEMFYIICDKGDADRTRLLTLLLQLAAPEEPRKEVLQRSALPEGLHHFIQERYVDLKCDVPKLPTILCEELLPALAKQALSETEITALNARVHEVEATDS